jgi:hypothetical protein
MISMFSKLRTSLLRSYDIVFRPTDQHVRCLAHIINLVVKSSLEELNASGLEIDEIEEETTSENNERLQNVIYKVNSN